MPRTLWYGILNAIVAAWVIAAVIQRVMGFRIAAHEEHLGLDTVLHGETGYAMGPS